jgi:SpoVK/Ycf46/Vps4 family AAA+-type ATPase
MPLAQDVDINLIAEYTNGFSGAELVAICSESALLAIDSNCDAVCQEHLLKSISDLKPQITPEMLEYYANIANTLFK